MDLNYNNKESLKIATINTWKCEGDYFERIKYLAEELKKLNLDIIICQECFFCLEQQIDTIDYLAEQLGIHKNYMPARKKERLFKGEKLFSESGLGILSKFKITNSIAITLPNVPGDDTRVLQKATISINNEIKLQIINVHLTHIDTTENHRLNQVDFLIKQIDYSKNFTIIGGDFNALPDSEEIQYLTDKGQLLDIYKFRNADIDRVSLVQPFEKGVKLNVDYFFTLQKSVQNGPIEIVNAQTILNHKNPINNEYASDHFGVMVEIKLKD